MPEVPRAAPQPKTFFPAGSCRSTHFSLALTPERAGWRYTGLCILELGAGKSHAFETAEDEMVVLPLSGSCVVECDGQRLELEGRTNVFARVSDFSYVPRDAHVRITSAQGGHFALPTARARKNLPFRYGPAHSVPIEVRGAAQSSRQINNFCSPDAFEADKLIAVEVLTPGGNWSSYPPHKHDQRTPTEEILEEIYYFEVARHGESPGVGYQRVYSSANDRLIEVCTEVRTGDVLVIPYGYHGPSMAAPGYDLYYLNVMAGPGDERRWRASDDPAHAWVRASWTDQAPDPRVPLTNARGRT